MYESVYDVLKYMLYVRTKIFFKEFCIVASSGIKYANKGPKSKLKLNKNLLFSNLPVRYRYNRTVYDPMGS